MPLQRELSSLAGYHPTTFWTCCQAPCLLSPSAVLGISIIVHLQLLSWRGLTAQDLPGHGISICPLAQVSQECRSSALAGVSKGRCLHQSPAGPSPQAYADQDYRELPSRGQRSCVSAATLDCRGSPEGLLQRTHSWQPNMMQAGTCMHTSLPMRQAPSHSEVLMVLSRPR